MASLGHQEETTSTSYMNITGYKFVKIPDRQELRVLLKDKCVELGLKGLILIAPEGFNYFVAGDKKGCDSFRTFLQEEESGRFRDIFCKVSFSKKLPFKRMLVKLKNEIIALGMDEVQPEIETGPRLEPEEFKKWLDEGKECVVVDTRNDYELRLGTFKNAVDLNLDSFKEFPAAVAAMSPELREKPIVTFCTGGVRCEKATVVMQNAGFKDVYQLEGGILNYFEKCGDAHWNGDCFVFDDRVAIDPNLKETDTTMCFKCRAPLTLSDRQNELYVYEKSCPYCITKPNETSNGGKKRFHTLSSSSSSSSSSSMNKKHSKKEEEEVINQEESENSGVEEGDSEKTMPSKKKQCT